MGSYITAVKQHFHFTAKEFIQLVVTAFFAAFVLSFRKWGEGSAVDIAVGTGNLLAAFAFVTLALIIHVVAQKLMAIKLGYEAWYGWWKLGIFFSLLITFLTNGWFPLFFPGMLDAKAIATLRVGKYMPRFKNWEFGLSCFAGPFANMLTILMLKPLFVATGSGVVMMLIETSMLVALFSMIPIPLFHGVKIIEAGRTAYDFRGGTIGFNIFFASRALYILFASFLFVYFLLVKIFTLFSFALSSLIAIIIFFIYYGSFEAK